MPYSLSAFKLTNATRPNSTFLCCNVSTGEESVGERVLHEEDKRDSAFPTRESTERERKTPPSIDHHHHHHRGRDRRTRIVVVASLPHHLSKAPFTFFRRRRAFRAPPRALASHPTSDDTRPTREDAFFSSRSRPIRRPASLASTRPALVSECECECVSQGNSTL